MAKKTKENLVSATYLLPEQMKEQIEEQAEAKDVSAGHLVRQILRRTFRPKPDSETTPKVR